MRLYIHMLLGGSICTLLYLFINTMPAYELPLKWRRFLIRINLIFYLLPLPWLMAEAKELLRWILEKAGMVFQVREHRNTFDAASAWNSIIVLDKDGRIVHVTGYQRLFPVIIAALLICTALLLGWLAVYLKAASWYKRNMVLLDVRPRAAGKHPRRIIVGISPCVTAPVTVGLIKPVILLPADYHEYENSMEEIMLHEINHICCMDIVERFLCFAAVTMYFYNPLVYYLLRENAAVSEMISDEAAVRGRTKAQKADYIRCIMAASRNMDEQKMTVLSLGKQKSLLRERMEKIMETGKKKVWKKKMAAAVIAGCVLASCIPALAYRKPHEYVRTGEKDWEDTDMLVFVQDGEENPIGETHVDFGSSDTVFTAEGGAVIYDMENCSLRQGQYGQERDICSHSYTTGTISEHDRHADGSCTVLTRHAKKCLKCESVIAEDEVSTVNYAICPHDGNTDVHPAEQLVHGTGIVNTDALKVRASASADAGVNTLLKEGAKVEITGETEEYYKINLKETDTGEILEGYVRKEYLNLEVFGGADEFSKITVMLPDSADTVEGYVRKEYLE